MDQRDSNYGQYVPPPQYQPYPPQKPKKRSTLGPVLLGTVVGIFVLIVIVAVASRGGSTGGGNVAASQTTAAGTPSTAAAAPAQPAAPPSSAAAPVQAAAPAGPSSQVKYSCTGSAPDGVDITYGTESSNSSASKLPFSRTVPLDSSAQYYDVTAQLSGSGTVSCTTTVWASDGTVTTKSGMANGGYNIASSEVCSTFDGSWDAC